MDIWIDATKDLLAATDALRSRGPAAMITAEGFRLAEAMNSIELLDPKLDFGVSRRSLASPAERIERGELPLATLTLPALLQLADKLLQLEVRMLALRTHVSAIP